MSRKPRWNLRLPLPAQASDNRIPGQLWDLLTLLLMVYDDASGNRIHYSSRRQRMNRLMVVPVSEPEFWMRDDVNAELLALLATLQLRPVKLEFVPLSEGGHCSIRISRPEQTEFRRDEMLAERPPQVFAFHETVDSLAAILEAQSEWTEQTEQAVLVSLHTDETPPNALWPSAAPTGVRRAQSLRVALNRTEERCELGQLPMAMINLLAASAIALSMECYEVCNPQNGIEYFMLPLTIAANSTVKRPHGPGVDTIKCLGKLITWMVEKPFQINNPLTWQTPAQTTARLLHHLSRSSAMDERTDERTVTDLLLGRQSVNESAHLDRCLVTMAALDGETRILSQHTQQELLRQFLRPVEGVPVRNYVAQLRELRELRWTELVERLCTSSATEWRGKRALASDVVELITRHSNEMLDVMSEILSRYASPFINGQASFRSFIGQALLPANLEQFQHPTLLRQGDLWIAWFHAGNPIYLVHSLGIQYIHYLLSNPNEQFSAIQLRAWATGNAELFSGRIAATDETAIRTYERYRDALLNNLRTSNDNDSVQRQKDQDALDAIEAELRYSTGRHGKPRDLGELERARRSVSNAIHRALKKLRPVHSELASYLLTHLHIGTFLSYQPRDEIIWKLG